MACRSIAGDRAGSRRRIAAALTSRGSIVSSISSSGTLSHKKLSHFRPYKFYIAFENTNCKDYVTEKFYETLRSRMAVPIVIHRKTYEDLGVGPLSLLPLCPSKQYGVASMVFCESPGQSLWFLFSLKHRRPPRGCGICGTLDILLLGAFVPQ